MAKTQNNKELDRVVKILTEKYEYAKRQTYVRDPLCYALYHTWRHYDEKKQRKRGDKDDY